MREKLKNDLILLLDKYVTVDALRKIEPQIENIISNYEIEARKTEVIPYGADIPETVEIYIVSKKIAGLSDKTLYLYLMVLTDFFRTVQKVPEKVFANDIRVYLYRYQKEHDISNRTLDCKRTIICSYFNWMAAEEYIYKNPAITIAPIKYERKHKKAMSQLDLEKIRLACQTKREKAIVEVLYSTGCRVTELERLNISDVNFETKEVILFGKGDKHRISYLNARAEVALRDYLDTRADNNPALFVYDRKPYARLKKSGIELLIRNMMRRTSGVTTHVTPHIFRHTTATTALDRGMSVVDVSRLLGHKRVDTTMEYITTNSESVKSNHKNYIV
ncbi:MAG: tyrosine-type recombinase/integrase [Lachnospiraceae bacterium]|nr:tyrosine-type recombinase/integrase [Lachnospiraceae bacterium]